MWVKKIDREFPTVRSPVDSASRYESLLLLLCEWAAAYPALVRTGRRPKGPAGHPSARHSWCTPDARSQAAESTSAAHVCIQHQHPFIVLIYTYMHASVSVCDRGRSRPSGNVQGVVLPTRCCACLERRRKACLMGREYRRWSDGSAAKTRTTTATTVAASSRRWLRPSGPACRRRPPAPPSRGAGRRRSELRGCSPRVCGPALHAVAPRRRPRPATRPTRVRAQRRIALPCLPSPHVSRGLAR